LLRFTAADVYGTPDLVAMQVRHHLALGQTDPRYIRALMPEPTAPVGAFGH
jgi:hypothetical protein